MNGWTAAPGEPTIASVGEVQAIRSFVDRLPESRERLLGPGDDAAILATPAGHVVVTSDSLIEGPDFRTEWSTPYDLGWKLAAVNLADIAAMGARPTALVVALAVPRDFPLAGLQAIADGLASACDLLAPGCGVEGGDLAVSPVITAVATALGSLDGRFAVPRSGARPGDVVALSVGAGHTFGDASRGLMALQAWPAEELPEDGFPGGTFIDAQLRPVPPIADGALAAGAGATSMLDISDGLALDAGRIADASNVTIDFDPGLLADLASGLATGLVGGVEELLEAAEDHALLATFPRNAVLPGGFRSVGQVLQRDLARVALAEEPYQPRGWDPFRA